MQEDLPESSRVVIPTPRDLEQERIQVLHDLWRANNASFLQALSSRRVPFFGLHGTPKHNLDALIVEKRGCLEICTFYEHAQDTKKTLSALSIMSAYAGSYAKTGGKPTMKNKEIGGVLLVDVEREGKNATFAWEPLGLWKTELPWDGPDEHQYFQNTEGNAYRSDVVLHTNNLTAVYHAKPEYFRSETAFQQSDGMEGITRCVLQARFRAQDILQFSLKALRIMDTNS